MLGNQMCAAARVDILKTTNMMLHHIVLLCKEGTGTSCPVKGQSDAVASSFFGALAIHPKLQKTSCGT